MSYKDDLKKLRGWLGKHETTRPKTAANTHDLRKRNERRREIVKSVRRWRKKNRKAYNDYQRNYMRAYRERQQAAGGGVCAAG